MDKKSKHIKAKNHLVYDIGDLVKFKPTADGLSRHARKKLWIIKDYVNIEPEDSSIYDYVLTDGSEEMVAIEYEIKKME